MSLNERGVDMMMALVKKERDPGEQFQSVMPYRKGKKEKNWI